MVESMNMQLSVPMFLAFLLNGTNGETSYLVTFDNAASATDKQCVVATAEDTAAPRQVTVTNTSTTQVTVRNWIDTGAAITAQNSFPISITRHLI